jgi:hypothetical protein
MPPSVICRRRRSAIGFGCTLNAVISPLVGHDRDTAVMPKLVVFALLDMCAEQCFRLAGHSLRWGQWSSDDKERADML